jgi:hypothetical protein
MPCKAVLSAAQQAALIALASADHDLRLHYTLSENDLAIVRSKRGPPNRLGFAIQLCYLRFPGQAPDSASPDGTFSSMRRTGTSTMRRKQIAGSPNMRRSTPGFTCNFSRLYRLLQNFDELGDCRVYLGLFFPNREQFELTLKFS